MPKTLAVAVIHGIGSQGEIQPTDSAVPTYSKDLHKRVKRELGTAQFDKVAWREIFWSDILQVRQAAYLKSIKRRTRYDNLREFVLCNLSDASAYRLTPGDQADNTYERIHARVTDTLNALDADTEDGSILIVLAHSLGGHIMSNYVYDAMKARTPGDTALRHLKTMAGFVTFGCNIPLFTFSYDPMDIHPIAFPGSDVPADKRQKAWWLNYYDKDDILGYPLKDIGPRYAALEQKGELKEKAINAGGILSSWNPGSHNGYWRDDDFYRPVAQFLKRFL